MVHVLRLKHSYRSIVTLFVVVVLLGGCGLPGVNIEQPTAPPATSSVAQADLQATVEAQVQATVAAAQASQPTAAPAAPTQAPAAPTQAPAAPTQAPAAPTQAPAAPTQASVSPAPVASGGGANRVVAVGARGNVSTLQGNAWVEQPGKFSSDICNDGLVLIPSPERMIAKCNSNLLISQDGGTTWSDITSVYRDARGTPVFAPNGDLWVISSRDIQVMGGDGKVTTLLSANTTNEQSFPFTATTFDSNGTLWIGGGVDTSSGLVSYDGTTWKKYADPLFTSPRPGEIEITARASVMKLFAARQHGLLAISLNRLFKLEGEKFVEYVGRDEMGRLVDPKVPRSADVRSVAEAPNGDLWLATSQGLFRRDGSGNLSLLDTRNGLPSRNIYDVQLDEQGRVWVATGYGIAVQNGDSWQVALPSTSGLADSEIRAIRVTGAPTLPEALATPKTTTIVGRATEGGTPMANTEIQLCSDSPDSSPRNTGNTPCEQQHFSQIATTDAQGNFRFENVPIGAYQYTLKPDGKGWAFILFGSAIVALEPGKEVTYDINLR